MKRRAKEPAEGEYASEAFLTDDEDEVVCQTCGDRGNAPKMMVCENAEDDPAAGVTRCNGGMHFYCTAGKPYETALSGSWYCNVCRAKGWMGGKFQGATNRAKGRLLRKQPSLKRTSSFDPADRHRTAAGPSMPGVAAGAADDQQADTKALTDSTAVSQLLGTTLLAAKPAAAGQPQADFATAAGAVPEPSSAAALAARWASLQDEPAAPQDLDASARLVAAALTGNPDMPPALPPPVKQEEAPAAAGDASAPRPLAENGRLAAHGTTGPSGSTALRRQQGDGAPPAKLQLEGGPVQSGAAAVPASAAGCAPKPGKRKAAAPAVQGPPKKQQSAFSSLMESITATSSKPLDSESEREKGLKAKHERRVQEEAQQRQDLAKIEAPKLGAKHQPVVVVRPAEAQDPQAPQAQAPSPAPTEIRAVVWGIAGKHQSAEAAALLPSRLELSYLPNSEAFMGEVRAAYENPALLLRADKNDEMGAMQIASLCNHMGLVRHQSAARVSTGRDAGVAVTLLPGQVQTSAQDTMPCLYVVFVDVPPLPRPQPGGQQLCQSILRQADAGLPSKPKLGWADGSDDVKAKAACFRGPGGHYRSPGSRSRADGVAVREPDLPPDDPRQQEQQQQRPPQPALRRAVHAVPPPGPLAWLRFALLGPFDHHSAEVKAQVKAVKGLGAQYFMDTPWPGCVDALCLHPELLDQGFEASPHVAERVEVDGRTRLRPPFHLRDFLRDHAARFFVGLSYLGLCHKERRGPTLAECQQAKCHEVYCAGVMVITDLDTLVAAEALGNLHRIFDLLRQGRALCPPPSAVWTLRISPSDHRALRQRAAQVGAEGAAQAAQALQAFDAAREHEDAGVASLMQPGDESKAANHQTRQLVRTAVKHRHVPRYRAACRLVVVLSAEGAVLEQAEQQSSIHYAQAGAESQGARWPSILDVLRACVRHASRRAEQLGLQAQEQQQPAA